MAAIAPFRVAAFHKRAVKSDGQTGECITPKQREVFLETLAKTGRMNQSSLAGGHVADTFRALIDNDPEFRAQAISAQEHFADTLEEEARRRAQDGVPRTVRYKGEEVGTEVEYSDRLMELLLKGHRRSKFGDEVKVDARVTAGVLVVPAMAMSSDEWQRQYQEQTLAASTKGVTLEGEAKQVEGPVKELRR